MYYDDLTAVLQLNRVVANVAQVCKTLGPTSSS